MDKLSILTFFLSFLSIVLIDLALSGDNAAVIGMAIRNLPPKERVRASVIGTVGAVLLRISLTVMATLLLKIHFLGAIGGLLLLVITWKLLNSDDSVDNKVNTPEKFWSAIITIILADLSMSFDNVLGIAGAAHGHILLIVFGLSLSIPILVAGSNLVASLMNRYPIIIYLGGAILAHTALKMVTTDRGLGLPALLGRNLCEIIPIILGVMVFLYGCYRTHNVHQFS